MILHRQDNLLYFGVGLFVEGLLNPVERPRLPPPWCSSRVSGLPRPERGRQRQETRQLRGVLPLKHHVDAGVWQAFKPHLRAPLFLWSLALVL